MFNFKNTISSFFTVEDPIAELIAELAAEPVTVPTAELVAELAAEPAAELVAEPVTVPTAEPAAEPAAEPTVKGPLFEAEEALEESLKRLSFLENQATMAAQEAAILAKVHEVNLLIRKVAVEMGEQRLLPRQMEERRKAVAAEDADILTMFKDLGF